MPPRFFFHFFITCTSAHALIRRPHPLTQGPDSPEWERYRMREYLLDAQADLRVMYDWYRSNPLPGEPPMKPENAVGICVNESHCVQPAIDLEGVRPKGCGEEFYVCDVCKSFGPMTINGAAEAAALRCTRVAPASLRSALPAWRPRA